MVPSTPSQKLPKPPTSPATTTTRRTTRTISIQQLSTSPSQKSSSRPHNPSSTSTSTTPNSWSHTPSRLTLLWLAISLPLVAWDTFYVLLRPWTMPGGFLHAPIWSPYALYGTVDYIYGFPAWNANNGFTAAQATLNVVETVGYVVYLALVLGGVEKGTVVKDGRGALEGKLGWLGEGRVLSGRKAGWAVMLGFAISVMTVSKTVLYWLNEAFSGFANIGHNSLVALVFLWVIPNGLWMVLPTYMSYVFGAEILEGLEAASGAAPVMTELKDD